MKSDGVISLMCVKVKCNKTGYTLINNIYYIPSQPEISVSNLHPTKCPRRGKRTTASDNYLGGTIPIIGNPTLS